MKKKIVFSLVLYGQSYIDVFKKYSYPTIKSSLSLIKEELYEKKLYLSCYESEKKQLLEFIDCFDSVEIFIIDNQNHKDNYSILSFHQQKHNVKAKNSNNDYLFFLYADFVLTKNVVLNSVNKIDKRIAVFTFALLLNSNKDKFENFIKDVEDDLDPTSKVNQYDLIDNYHKSFRMDAFNISKSFVYCNKGNDIYLKAFHMHPVIINLKKIDIKNLKNSFYTLDNGFLRQLNLKKEDIYVEEDLNKICIFSFDTVSRLKRLESDLNIDKESFKYVDKGFFYLNYNINDEMECWMFDKFTFTNNIKGKSDNILDQFYKSKNPDKKEYFYAKEILKEGRNYINSSTKHNNDRLNYLYVFFNVLFFSVLILLPKSKMLNFLYIYIRNTLFSGIKKGFLTRTSSPNVIYSIYISKALYAYLGIFLLSFLKAQISKIGIKK